MILIDLMKVHEREKSWFHRFHYSMYCLFATSRLCAGSSSVFLSRNTGGGEGF